MLAFEVLVIEAGLSELALDLAHLALVAAVLRLQALSLGAGLLIGTVSLNAKVDDLEALLVEAGSQRIQVGLKGTPMG